jgi:hypothetical protein
VRRLSRMRRGRTVDMGVGVIVSMRMPVVLGMVMGMAMSMIVMMGLGNGGNHAGMLYYNITPVHAGLGLADHHGDGGCDERERHRNRASEPDETGRHERNFPQNHPLEGKQRPCDDIGDHLRHPTA